MRLRIFLLILCLLALKALGKSVQTGIHAKWTQTSVLAEISESIQDEELFWKFVDAVNEKNNTKLDSSRSLYDLGVSVASEILKPSDMDLLRFSLSTRTMSPRVEVHRQLAMKYQPKKCPASFFVYGTQVECDINELNIRVYNKSGEEIFPFDHIYPVGSPSQRTIFVYGELGTKTLQKNIKDSQKLIDVVDGFRFIFRHFKLAPIPGEVSLSGYGVELALKNTEYKAVDSSHGDDLPENLHGLNFKMLVDKYPEQQKELESLRENLEKLGEIVPLKQWQLKDLGYKTCEKMRAMEVEDVEEMLHDFPMHARTISHQTLNQTFVTSIKIYQSKLESAGIENGQNLLAINGRIVSKMDSRIDLFSLIDTIKQEKKYLDELVEMGLASGDYTKLLTLVDFSPVDLSGYAFDYREAKPEFLNNIETMLGLYKSLYLLLQPFPPGQIRPISRNIFNVVLFTDPFDSDDTLYEKIQEFVNSGVYIRFGIVPIFDEKKHKITIEEAVETKKVDSEKKSIWRTKTKLLEALKKGNKFLTKSGFQIQPIALLNGYPLDTTSPEAFDLSLAENIQKQTLRLQLALYQRLLEDSTKIDEWWMKKDTNPDIVKRISQRVAHAFNQRNYVQLNQQSSEVLKNLRYYTENLESQPKNSNVTTWIITDFQSPENRVFVAKILRSVATKNHNKVALIANPKNSRKPCTKYLDEEASGLQELISLLENDVDYCTRAKIPHGFLSRYGGRPGDTALISNGLIIGIRGEEYLEMEDLEYLDQLWKEKGAGKASAYLNTHFSEDVSINFYSTISKTYQRDQPRIRFDEFQDPNKTNVITFPPKTPDFPSITVTWIANPVSREAQHLVSIVKLLTKILNSRVEIILNPPAEILEMPIKRFYRFVASEDVEFNEDGFIEPQYASFSNLPRKQLLTMSMETNDAWMIEVKRAEYDLDNILLDASEDVTAEFSLEHILVEGQSHETAGDPSSGLELELNSEDVKYDTIVMRNLGYFQLKAQPGIWNLKLRNGSSSENHRIVKIDGKNKKKEDVKIVVDSFTGKWTQLIVEKLYEDQDPEGSSIEKLMKSAKDYFTTPTPSEVINVFSLASGHLYERFMRIMMVSVMKNTQSPKVKFWLLKNYLSPKFKESIPILAKFYGFEYELVEYKWPKWLHQQTEKQRVMWGYKILFLDVLFPLNVDKIIFVDADQVVRADLLDLMNQDLGGAPYGYVPFCESRKEMDGFRFWKSGYWNNHLMGRRYHISALYVVDLKAFRKFSAGDRLRGRYDTLSADPNSLSNLDQDLPNNMIHEVPIKSLPQEWLWCETWCDDDTKSTAKTIDLCNNPLTKEPKLNSAQRIIHEWKDIDEEISEVILSNGQVPKTQKTPDEPIDHQEL